MTIMPPMAVLAGGLATRMYPLTEAVPKSMLEVAGVPFIDHQLRLFAREGITEVVLCLGYLGDKIRDHVGDGSHFGLAIRYSQDGNPLLGTGGALRKATLLLGREFLVCYGDSYLDISYRPVVEAFRASFKAGLMTVYRNEDAWDASNVEFDGEKILAYDKVNKNTQMRHIDWGLGVLRTDCIQRWPDNVHFGLDAVYRDLLKCEELAVQEVHTRFYEIGSRQGLAETDALLRRQLKLR